MLGTNIALIKLKGKMTKNVTEHALSLVTLPTRKVRILGHCGASLSESLNALLALYFIRHAYPACSNSTAMFVSQLQGSYTGMG